MNKEFRDSINKALHNANLTGALGRFSETYRTSRLKAYEGIDFEVLRTRIAELKSYAASHLNVLSELFAKECRGKGCKGFQDEQSRKG